MIRMIKPPVVFLVVAALSCVSCVTSRAADSSFEDLEKVWNEAHLAGDVETLEGLWADDIVIFVPSMPSMSKADAMSMWRQVPVTFTQYESSDLKIRRFSDSAVITGRIDRTRDFGGRAAQERWHFTKLYERRGGKWVITVFHASETE